MNEPSSAITKNGIPVPSENLLGPPLARRVFMFFHIGTKRGPDSTERHTKLQIDEKKVVKTLTSYFVLTLVFGHTLWEVDFSKCFFSMF